jgi:CHASE2 domain-containing sensor protein/predicted Ser/Thr protein kinase
MRIFKKYSTMFLGLAVFFLFTLLGLNRMALLDALELKFYDARIRLREVREPSNEIVIVNIDNDSIEKLGRWPWPRSLIAQGVNKIDAGDPKVIGLNIIYSEKEESSGLKELSNIENLIFKALPNLPKKKRFVSIINAIKEAQIRLDHDTKLEEAISRSGKVALPVSFEEDTLVKEAATPENKILIDQSIKYVENNNNLDCPSATEILLPIDPFLSASKGIGHINFTNDMDGIARRERLFYEFNGLYVPSYTLKLSAIFLGIPDDQISADIGTAVHLGPFRLPTTKYSEMLISFKGPGGSFKNFSFFDVINDKIPLGIFKNKIVLITPSATGMVNPLSTPTDNFMSVGEFSANAIWAILHERLIQDYNLNFFSELFMIFIFGLIITFVLPRLKAMPASLTFIGLLVFILGGSTYLFVSKGLWVKVIYPAVELVIGYMGVVSIQYFITQTGKEKVEHIEKHDNKFKDAAERKKKLIQASETMVFGNGSLNPGSGDGSLTATGIDTRPTLGRYEVIKKIGKGAMGVVYLGQDPRINRITAIKTVRFADDFEPEEAQKMKEKFFREAESAGTLSHPNIVTIYDAGEEQDLAYIAMEFLEGTDLETHTKKGNLLPMRKVIGYIADIADGLDYAHERGIIHRDIKPANIMLLKSGIVKITDFGIAKITASSQTKTGMVKGTPFYMSPEQIAGKKVDGRSDIFSLGVMLFQLVTGEVPFTGDSPASLMHQILNVPHPNPKTLNPKIVQPLVPIIDKTLEKDRKNRYQKASRLSANLKELGKRIDAAILKRKGG